MKRALKIWFPPFVIVAVLLFLIHQLMERVWGIHILLLDNWLDPILFMPILLHGMDMERIFSGRKALRVGEKILMAVWVSVLVEILFPLWSPRFTRDIWDVGCYFAGTLFYTVYRVRNPLKKETFFSKKFLPEKQVKPLP